MVVDGSDRHALTHGPEASDPVWSPDGSKLAFIRVAAGEGRRST